MEVYSDYVTDVVFGEGPLYFSIQKSDNDHVTVKGFKKTEGEKHPPIEVSSWQEQFRALLMSL